MPVDEDLADRIRELVAGEAGWSEGSMFGGIAFLLHGHMAICASGKGGLLVRVDPDATAELLERTVATPMVMRGREVRGWVRVADEHVRTRRQLATWYRRGRAVAAGLPPKRPRRSRGPGPGAVRP